MLAGEDALDAASFEDRFEPGHCNAKLIRTVAARPYRPAVVMLRNLDGRVFRSQTNVPRLHDQSRDRKVFG